MTPEQAAQIVDHLAFIRRFLQGIGLIAAIPIGVYIGMHIMDWAPDWAKKDVREIFKK